MTTYMEDLDGYVHRVQTAEEIAADVAHSNETIAWMRKSQAMQQRFSKPLTEMIEAWDYDREELLTFVKIFFDENPRD
jgi:hypothetical protein